MGSSSLIKMHAIEDAETACETDGKNVSMTSKAKWCRPPEISTTHKITHSMHTEHPDQHDMISSEQEVMPELTCNL